MQLDTAKTLLSSVFTTVKIQDTNEERTCFQSEYMSEDSGDKYEVYRNVSDAMHDSGLTHDFSYEIASRAVQILAELADWDDMDAISEQVDSSVPIYNGEITEIYTANSWAVDEARESMGAVDSIKDAQMAWYSQIEQMIEAIKGNFDLDD